jgi:UDP-N-acetylmuramyl pentapeptide phosphotransferase/UDP-N-acetylglucosamine-1-phosphate transferase
MSALSYIVIALVLVLLELLYFKIAKRYAIVDRPNNRSSHTGLIIRGGGVIFILAVLSWFVTADFQWPWFLLGATLLAVISFLDDVKPQLQLVRFTIHLTVVLLLFYDAQLFSWPIWLIVLAALVCIGSINAFNFMDGINGITGIHAVVSLGTFIYIQEVMYPFSSLSLMITCLLSVFIFLFFNFRTQAKCFAGDVGSTTLAFIQIFLLLQLIVYTDNFLWVIMFLVFGIDSVVTIICRLLKKENIFRAHRTHLYQYLSNEIGLPHTRVAAIYGIIQLALNVSLVTCLPESKVIWPLLSSSVFILLYLVTRHKLINKVRHAAHE